MYVYVYIYIHTYCFNSIRYYEDVLYDSRAYLLDIGMLGTAKIAERAISSTAQYDICHRVFTLSQDSLGYHETTPAATELLDKVYTPAFARIELLCGSSEAS